MKKILNLLLSCVVALTALGARDALAFPAIGAADPSGRPGDTVSVDVSLTDGDISFGADFSIDYDPTRLSFVDILGATGDFLPLYTPPAGGSTLLSLVNANPALGVFSGPIFSILFAIVDPYPAALPDVATVLIGGSLVATQESFQPLAVSISVVPGTTPVSEPASLALLGLAFGGAALARRRTAV